MHCIFFISICTYPYNSSGYHVDTYYHYQLHISNVIMQIVILQNLNVRCTIWFIYVSSSHHPKYFLKKSPALDSCFYLFFIYFLFIFYLFFIYFLIFSIVQSTVSDLLKDSNPLGLEWKSPGSSSSLKYCRCRGWNCCPLAWELGKLPLDQLVNEIW